MSIESLAEAVAEFLSVLERKEASLLSWGAVNGFFSTEEVEDLAAEFVDQHSLWDIVRDPIELVDELVERQLLFEFINTGEFRYRTRMAEAVRLFSKLRQIFPKHIENGTWRTAPSLAADYRLIIRPRSYPKRELPPTEVIEELEQFPELGSLGADAVKSTLGQSIQLAKFQFRAAKRILRELGAKSARGTVICAGTGSGKTLAFYLPALAQIAELIDDQTWTRCLAIYPRNELLKDQFSGTYEEARKLDATLKSAGKRKLRIGAFYGSAPYNCKSDLGDQGWRRTTGGYVCPFLPCPSPDCDGDLVWKDDDRHDGREKLTCISCTTVVAEDEVALTRESMRSAPPDILFTTTEMLNQRMTDSRCAHLFGIGTSPRQKPRFVLLDEVHTYDSTHGAQVAHLIRRWKQASGSRPHFVGLSATLRDARNFFARLVGLDEYRVVEVSPGRDELVHEGMEYNLALRGDPVSKTSLLSTTIQAAMLMGRVLDPRDVSPSNGQFGSRVFLFTDDLDVTNRLYFNLLDAEGRNSWGEPDESSSTGSLANLRADTLAEARDRFSDGQNWKLSHEIGHSLGRGPGLEVDRTSSQDSGVTPDSDIVVATASLEVGYNDPEVGAVIQHKAPRGEAQFLQRKGRAGRPREMRPWTVVVLSDYGRDRMAYQAYDQLFDPELRPRSLPTTNIYVVRMQATFALMDWLSSKMPDSSRSHIWREFAQPVEENSKYWKQNRERQQKAAEIVEKLLTDEKVREDFAEYLRQALDIDDDVVQLVMWEPPRALIKSVVPTILRRLKTNWRVVDPSEEQDHDYYVKWSPLPEFVPQNLFNDLNLPEVKVVTPPQTKNDDPREDYMPILQAMREYSPGRVSRRFGIGHAYARHWIAPPQLNDEPVQSLELEDYCSVHEELGEFQVTVGERTRNVRVVRPWQFEPVKPEARVSDSSNSFLDWSTQIIPPDEGWTVDLPTSSPTTDWVTELAFYTHNQFNPVEVRRFATGTDASISLKTGDTFSTRIDFVDGDDPVGLGFVLDVDGLVFRLSLPDELNLSESRGRPEKLRALRTQYFHTLIEQTAELDGIANFFQRGWLSEIYLSALTWLALEHRCSLQDARKLLQSDESESFFEDVLSVIFQSSSQIEGTGESSSEQIHDELLKLLTEPAVQEVLHRHATVLWEEPDETWEDWIEDKFKATYGSAILEACHQLCPDIDSDDLILDTSPGPRPPGKDELPDDIVEVWITETTVGGGGVIEQILERYGEDPRRFFQLLEGALEPGEFERMDSELQTLLQWATDEDDHEVKEALRSVRNFETHRELRTAFDELTELLAARGLFVSHSVVAALNARILRPGSSHSTDLVLKNLLELWDEEERRLGIEIDARVFSYVASEDSQLDDALEHLDEAGQPSRQWRFNTLYSLLWPRGSNIRSRSLSSYNPYTDLPDSERLLISDCLSDQVGVTSLTDSGWHEELVEKLRRESIATLRCEVQNLNDMNAAISEVVAQAIDVGFMLVYPRIRGVEKKGAYVDVVFELAEVV